MLLTPGPAEMDMHIRQIGAEPLGYFRSTAYCDEVKSLTELLKMHFQTQQTPLTITGSGTAGMELALVNLFSPGDRVVSVNAGTFGAKWAVMARGLGLDVVEYVCEHGQHPDLDQFDRLIDASTKGVLLTAHETSTGYLFDLPAMIARAKAKGCLCVVDGVSSIGADPFYMDDWGVDCAISCSQKALACMPGLTFVALSPTATEQVYRVTSYRAYLDARTYIDNIGRGMLPFTPAMHATMQVLARLQQIQKIGHTQALQQTAEKAQLFRDRLFALNPQLSLFAARSSVALSAIQLPDAVSARQLIEVMKVKYDWILPNNPTGSDRFIRISHMGDLSASMYAEVAEKLAQEIAFLSEKGAILQ